MATGDAKSDYLENKVLDHVLRNTAYAQPATVYASLFTVAPTDAGGGTEVVGGGYVRKPITFGAAAGGSASNTVIVDFGTASAAWGTVVAVGIHDAAAAGNLLYWGLLTTNRTINAGDAATFPVGNLVVAEA